MDSLARIRSFPKAPSPNDDASAIRGNITLEQKQLNANILAYHVGADKNVFAGDLLKGMKLVEANVKRRREDLGGRATGVDGLEGEAIIELDVSEGMLNAHGAMSGGCFATILDIATFAALFTLGLVLNADASGMSSSMDIRWHAPATPGMTLSIVSTSITMKGRIHSSRAEMFDKKTGKLLASTTHNITPFSTLPTSRNQKTKTKL